VLERVIDDWLTKTTERAFQAPFCQMLVARGETVVHSSRHCAMELGKDVISIASTGRVHAYQLKTAKGGRLSLGMWRNGLQQQSFDLVASAVRHPSIQAGRHHRSFFVVNGTLNEEVTEDIERMNQGWAQQGLHDYRLETIVGGQLAKMATDLQTSFWPEELSDVNLLLELYLDLGGGQLPKNKFSTLLEATAKLNESTCKRISKAQCHRLMASSGVLCALALSRFTKEENRLAEIEAWTIHLAIVFGLAQRRNLGKAVWGPSVNLASIFILGLLEQLANEVTESHNLIVGHPVSDRFVREIRVTHLVSLMSILWLWRRSDGIEIDEFDESLRNFSVNHARHVTLWGEASASQLLAIFWGLRSMDPRMNPDNLLLSQIDRISAVNGQNGSGRLFSPYYGPEDVCERLIGLVDEDLPESFRHRSHSIESFLALTVRENLRQSVSMRWSAISHLMFAEFETEKAWQIFRWRNRNNGQLVLRMPQERQSWNELRRMYCGTDMTTIPKVLRKHPIQTLLFLICYPHRLKPSWVVWLDSALRV